MNLNDGFVVCDDLIACVIGVIAWMIGFAWMIGSFIAWMIGSDCLDDRI